MGMKEPSLCLALVIKGGHQKWGEGHKEQENCFGTCSLALWLT